MGLLGWLFGSKPQRVQYAIEGSGDYELDVVGESHYQAELNRICGGKTDDGHEMEVEALLVEEPTNPYDSNAVAVVIDGLVVAYLPRDDAAAYRQLLSRQKLSGEHLKVDALIVGGWNRGRRGQGHYGVKLDVDMPLTIREEPR
ncbi:HIRAN domain-containing protein [Consotaella salsifontis]|uniref:HIRAN domain-containing protein n=1 Tax=Consotaella salsifontis TaxID=1365950 RepID=A0A1T4SDM2_9HYPH|nr:HIRAN domain-containing protein [Consotaella salsifontis]SKA26275.1 hypothetical protein SAMN05428963_11057 [Consotaella salsifontis]